MRESEPFQALYDAVMAVGSNIQLRPTLEHITEAAARLVDARYAALGVLDRTGEALSEFVTVGIDEAGIAAIGALPHGRGVLGLLIKDPRPLRLHDVAAHAESYGFPAHHPPMRTFLGVPIVVRGNAFGNLYLTERRGGDDFTSEDEDAVVALAAAAGVAIENADLYEQSEQRLLRVEATAEIQHAVLEQRPIPDLLQLVAERALKVTRGHTSFVVLPSRKGYGIVQAAAGHNATELNGTEVPLTGTFADVMERGATLLLPQGLAHFALVSAGPAMLVPLSGPDEGRGGIVVTREQTAQTMPDDDDLATLHGFASQMSIALRLAGAQADRANLAVVEDRERIARDLHDLVIQRLFAIGLTLQTAGSRVEQPEVAEKLADSVKEIDRTIHDIRSTIFELELDHLRGSLRGQIIDLVGAAPDGINPDLSIEGPIDLSVPAPIGAALLAVLAEGLANAARHASADRVAVEVIVGPAELSVTVSDDGIGFESADQLHSGLRNMTDRAAALGGECRIDSARGAGTTIRWRVPLDASS